eukprot:11277986-Alexandrium_andersonii.AAC.1
MPSSPPFVSVGRRPEVLSSIRVSAGMLVRIAASAGRRPELTSGVRAALSADCFDRSVHVLSRAPQPTRRTFTQRLWVRLGSPATTVRRCAGR